MTDTAKEPGENGSQVFISYATPDRHIADMIYSGLKSKGIKGWVAHRDIDGGMDWTDEISETISQSEIFIVVISQNTENSNFVKDEVTFAKDENKMIIPFYIENVSLQGGWKLLLSTRQRIDAFSKPKEKHLEQLIETVLSHMGKAPVIPTKNVEERKEGKKTRKCLLPKPILIAISIIILLIAAVFLKNQSGKKEVKTIVEPPKETVKPANTSDNKPSKQQSNKEVKPPVEKQESANQVQKFTPIPNPPPINQINQQQTEVNPLKVSIICKRKEESAIFEVSPHVVLYSGDLIWFEITLPELGGYLLVYAKDSHGKVFNLFPGTRNAIKEGKYKFPFHLENYSTEVLKLTREQSIDLPGNKLRIGGYTLDENTGSEYIYFYYSNQRDKRLENYLKKYASDVGQDITFKGFQSTVEKYTQSDVNASISTPLLRYTETHLSLKHE